MAIFFKMRSVEKVLIFIKLQIKKVILNILRSTFQKKGFYIVKIKPTLDFRETLNSPFIYNYFKKNEVLLNLDIRLGRHFIFTLDRFENPFINAIYSSINENNLETFLNSIRRSRLVEAVSSIQQESAKKDLNKLTIDDINLEINGNSNGQAVNWDDNLRYQLEITNTSDTEVSDIKITALLDSGVLDWESLETIGAYQESNIIWTSAENEELLSWPAGETKMFTWQLDVVEEPQSERIIENIIKLNIQGLTEWEQISSPIILTVGESLTFNNGIYWDLGGRRVGSGLLPPQVGETTQYLAVWSLTDVTGEFDTVSVSTVLPPEVGFISETDVQEGMLDFDPEGRVLSWSLSGFDDYIWPLTATFIIELEPNKDNRGEVMTLFNSTTVVASGLEEVIVRSKPIKTSDVVADSDGPVGIVE